MEPSRQVRVDEISDFKISVRFSLDLTSSTCSSVLKLQNSLRKWSLFEFRISLARFLGDLNLWELLRCHKFKSYFWGSNFGVSIFVIRGSEGGCSKFDSLALFSVFNLWDTWTSISLNRLGLGLGFFKFFSVLSGSKSKPKAKKSSTWVCDALFGCLGRKEDLGATLWYKKLSDSVFNLNQSLTPNNVWYSELGILLQGLELVRSKMDTPRDRPIYELKSICVSLR